MFRIEQILNLVQNGGVLKINFSCIALLSEDKKNVETDGFFDIVKRRRWEEVEIGRRKIGRLEEGGSQGQYGGHGEGPFEPL